MHSRRHARTTAVVIAVASTLLLASCGGGGGSAGDGDSTSLLPDAEGTTQYPLTLDTWAGESTLQERPERIAVIGFSPNRDALEAIGATPVYALSDTAWEWSDQEWVDSIETVDTATRSDPINVEGIAASNPDLIIATNFIIEQADFDQLSEIAPVLETVERADGDKIDWRATQQLIGDTLDLREAADAAIAESDEAVAAVAEAHPEFAGQTATIAYHYTGSPLEYYTPTDGTAEDVVVDLGFSPNPLAEQFTTTPEVADENLGELDADALVVFYDSEEEQEARESQEVFQSIPAVEDGRYTPVVFADDLPGANSSWVMRRGASALALPFAAEYVAEWASAALQG